MKIFEKCISKALKSVYCMLKLYENAVKKTKFMCIIVGHYDAVTQDKEIGIYIVPITSLKP